MAEIKNTEMIRDALGSPIPQKWDEESQTFIASTVDGSEANVDFSKKKMIRDRLGSPIPQKWDNDAGKFVPSAGGVDGEVTIESIPGLQTELNEVTVKLAEEAEKLERLKTDKANKVWGNWINGTLLNGWTLSPSVGEFKYRKNDIGNVVLSLDIVAGTIAPLTIIGSIPADYSPSKNIIVEFVSASGQASALKVYINQNGNIYVASGSNFVAGATYSAQSNFSTAE